MAKIQELLDNLLHKKLGRDVRQSIHDSIEQCYKDATGHPESVAGVIEENKNMQKQLDSNINTINGRIDTILTGTVNTTKLVTVHSATIRNNSASDLTFKISSKDNETLKSIKDKSPTVINANVIAKALDGVAINGKGIPSSYNVESTNDEYVITVYSGSSSVVGQYVFMAVVTIAYEDTATDISSAELKDIRTGANDTTYPTAGDAVREQINDLKKELDDSNLDENVSQIQKNMTDISQLKESIGNVNEEISGLKGVGSGLTTEQKRYIVSLFKSAVYSENMSDMVTALEDSFNTIPATGIKLSPTTIKFSGIGDTQKITATLTSDTATSSILWESNNTDVVTVKDGVATAVSDGIATITATSGSATAKCNVTVNTKELYSISNKVCNADFYEATGLKLGSDSANGYAKSWTLLANYSTKANDVVSGMNASEKNALQFGTNGANNSQNYWLKNGIPTTKYQNDNYANWCFAITHDANSNDIVFYEYVNDELKTSTVHPGFNTPNSDVYNGELYIGGTTSAGYVGTIYNFDIVMRIMTRDEITTLLKGGVY